MQGTELPRRFGDHHNAFGFLRLVLASLVIVSHTPELVDGNRSRELLTNLFHSISFGELSVDGFFILSGFLITASCLNSASTLSYVRKRIARIYPAFIVSSLVCLIVIKPLAGGQTERNMHGIARALGRIAILCPPAATDVFAGTPYSVLNGAAWTIQYEFACYLVIGALGLVGVLRSVWVVGFASIACLAVSCIAPPPPGISAILRGLPLHGYALLGDRMEIFRLVGLFLTGSTFYLGQGRIPISKLGAGMAFVLLCALLFAVPVANLIVAVFGSYLLFSLAVLGSTTFLAQVNNRNDISYGLYLYAWPIEKLLLWWHVSDSLIVVGLATWVLAAAAGTLSWLIIEKPAMRWGRPKAKARHAEANSAFFLPQQLRFHGKKDAESR